MRKKPFVIWAICLIVIAYLLIPVFWKVRNLSEERGLLEEEVRALMLTNKKLEHELYLLQNDPVYLEALARRKLRGAKEGEVIVKLVDEGVASDQSL